MIFVYGRRFNKYDAENQTNRVERRKQDERFSSFEQNAYFFVIIGKKVHTLTYAHFPTKYVNDLSCVR